MHIFFSQNNSHTYMFFFFLLSESSGHGHGHEHKEEEVTHFPKNTLLAHHNSAAVVCNTRELTKLTVFSTRQWKMKAVMIIRECFSVSFLIR